MEISNCDTAADFEAIFASDETDIEKLVRAFDWITRRDIAVAHHEIDLARAMQDQEAVVKQQIRLESMKNARAIFQNCYLRATNKRSRIWTE